MNKVNLNNYNHKMIENSHRITKESTTKSTINKGFQEIYKQVTDEKSEIKFSKHAITRMNSRNIKLNHEEMMQIENAMDKAASKGVKEALILMKDTAFIASIKNKMIITTATSEQLKDNVFTNIDGAVIV